MLTKHKQSSPMAPRHTSRPPLHFMCSYNFNGPGVIVVLVQALLLLAASRTGGITHWKLSDDTITPGPAPSLDMAGKTQSRPSTKSEDVYAASQLAATDPEFALLIRYSAKSSSGSGSPNRGGRGHGVFRRHETETQPSSCDYDGNREVEEGDEGSAKAHGSAMSRSLCQQSWEMKKPRKPDGSGPMSASEMAEAQPSPLTCGDPILTMPYDFLKGIARRKEHKPFPEPEVAMIFKKSELDSTVDLFDIEMGLRKAYQENPQSITVLNQIGNFWRIKGDTQQAIECFRKALYHSSDHPDLLLNLARVLFNLKFYDDAIFLAKKSLHVKSSDNHAWLQYFTLGEVYKALEKYDEAVFYFKKSLEKNPDLHVAEMHLHELGMDQEQTLNIYTLLIIFVLISIVLIMIYYIIGAMNV